VYFSQSLRLISVGTKDVVMGCAKWFSANFFGKRSLSPRWRGDCNITKDFSKITAIGYGLTGEDPVQCLAYVSAMFYQNARFFVNFA
jgi:hypothetical protein